MCDTTFVDYISMISSVARRVGSQTTDDELPLIFSNLFSPCGTFSATKTNKEVTVDLLEHMLMRVMFTVLLHGRMWNGDKKCKFFLYTQMLLTTCGIIVTDASRRMDPFHTIQILCRMIEYERSNRNCTPKNETNSQHWPILHELPASWILDFRSFISWIENMKQVTSFFVVTSDRPVFSGWTNAQCREYRDGTFLTNFYISFKHHSFDTLAIYKLKLLDTPLQSCERPTNDRLGTYPLTDEEEKNEIISQRQDSLVMINELLNDGEKNPILAGIRVCVFFSYYSMSMWTHDTQATRILCAMRATALEREAESKYFDTDSDGDIYTKSTMTVNQRLTAYTMTVNKFRNRMESIFGPHTF